MRVKKFLGLNTKSIDTVIDFREASALQNVNITDESVEARNGSTLQNAVAFKDKTDTTAKAITGLYEAKLNGILYKVGIGGDAFKEFTGGAWVDRTGSVTITDDDDIKWSFATFVDNSADEVIIAANGVDAPIKWTGSGDATDLATPPGNFNYPTVHKNKLWVAVDDIVYFSDIRDGETWDTADDLFRLINKGEKITGMVSYSDRLVVFQETAIHLVYGSENRDLYVDTVVKDDGCLSGATIKEVESKRYGNILVFMSSKGILKGFNGSKNLIDIGEPIRPLFEQMNRDRFENSVGEKYDELGQYWLSLTYGSGSQNNQIIIYDYKHDYFSDENGRPLSSMLYHTGISANAMANWTESSVKKLITCDYNGFALKQNDGDLDEEVSSISSLWQTKKLDFGSPTNIKLITDLSVVTTQTTTTNMSLSIITDKNSGEASLSIPVSGGLWGYMLWGTGLWSAPSTKYTRAELTNSDPDSEDAIAGRYIQCQIIHSTASEDMRVNELIIGATDLGYQPEYVET